MAWFRREHPAYLSFNCFGCEASYSATTTEAITTFAREHQAQCHIDRTTPAGVIQVDGTVTPELMVALRRTIRRQGGDAQRALG